MVLLLDYTDKNGHLSSRFVRVLNLVIKSPRKDKSYVRVWDFDRGAPRTFRLNRISNARKV